MLLCVNASTHKQDLVDDLTHDKQQFGLWFTFWNSNCSSSYPLKQATAHRDDSRGPQSSPWLSILKKDILFSCLAIACNREVRGILRSQNATWAKSTVQEGKDSWADRAVRVETLTVVLTLPYCWGELPDQTKLHTKAQGRFQHLGWWVQYQRGELGHFATGYEITLGKSLSWALATIPQLFGIISYWHPGTKLKPGF